MALQGIENTFIKGMDQDTSKNARDNQSYFSADNLRLINGSTDSGAMTNVMGNTLEIEFEEENEVLVGYTLIRDVTVFFTVYRYLGKICSNIYTYTNTKVLTKIYTDRTILDNLGNPYTEEDLLNLGGSDIIAKEGFTVRAVGRYETEDKQLVYFVDGVNLVRAIDITKTYNDVKGSYFNMIPDNELYVEYSQPIWGSGNLDVGIISYSYQIITELGIESVYTPCSGMYSIIKDNLTFGEQGQLFGGDVDSNSNKSISLTLSGIKGNIKTIRVVAIHYTALNLTPQIRIVEEVGISEDTHTITDYGQSLGTYTLEEFGIIGSTALSAKTLETKDNRLFIGNIEDKYFDYTFDARVYRYSGGICRVYNKDDSYYEIDENGNYTLSSDLSTGTNWQLPIDADCINKFNDLSNDFTTNHQYKYKGNTTILGAIGPNLEVNFKIKQIYCKISPGASEALLNSSYREHVIENIKSWQRGEIYRLGIVFFNDGLSSPVKWIGDIRIPEISDFNIRGTLNGFDTSDLIYPEVVFKNPSPYDYQIVCVKREDKDKTVIAMGAVGAPYRLSQTGGDYVVPRRDNRQFGSTYYLEALTNLYYPPTQPIIEFISADMSFDIDKVNLAMTDVYFEGKYIPEEKDFYTGIGFYNLQTDIVRGKRTINDRIYTKSEEDNLFEDTTTYTLGGLPLRNAREALGTTWWNFGRSVFILCDSSYTEAGYAYCCTLRADIQQYGGNTYEARINNVYITASPLNSGECLYGDMYIQEFNYLDSYYEASDGQRYNTSFVFPMESFINMELRNDDTMYKIRKDDEVNYLTEFNNIYLNNVLKNYSDAYIYNTVFSQQNTSRVFIPIDERVLAIRNYDCRVYYSDEKINGELTNSWLKFRDSNKNDVDSTYGELKRLYNHKNRLMFFQENGVGVWSVNQRSLIQDNNVGSLELGVGDILDRYDYITQHYGVYNPDAVIPSHNYVYFIDVNRKEILRVSEGLEHLSEQLGLRSWTEENLIRNYSHGVYNPNYGEVWFDNLFSNKTLVFSEYVNRFISFYDSRPSLYVKIGLDIYSTRSNLSLYLFDSPTSEYGKFNGLGPYDSSIDLIINPNGKQKAIFDLCAITTDIEDGNDNVYDETITSLRASNNYLDSGELDTLVKTEGHSPYGATHLDPHPVVGRFREWRFNIPRAFFNEEGTQIFSKPRFRDTHLRLKLWYNNRGNKKFRLHNILTKYRNRQL